MPEIIVMRLNEPPLLREKKYRLAIINGRFMQLLSKSLEGRNLLNFFIDEYKN